MRVKPGIESEPSTLSKTKFNERATDIEQNHIIRAKQETNHAAHV